MKRLITFAFLLAAFTFPTGCGDLVEDCFTDCTEFSDGSVVFCETCCDLDDCTTECDEFTALDFVTCDLLE